MPRFRILIALAVAACAIAVTASAAAARSPEMLMIHKVNHYRRLHGLRPLRVSHSLMHSAKSYAHWEMRHGYFGHQSRIHASGRYRRLGEILEWQRGLSSNIRLAFNTWKHSSSHRAIMLDRKFTYVGAGHVHGRFHGRKSTLWVMHFGRP